jgi:hypothetical protein
MVTRRVHPVFRYALPALIVTQTMVMHLYLAAPARWWPSRMRFWAEVAQQLAIVRAAGARCQAIQLTQEKSILSFCGRGIFMWHYPLRADPCSFGFLGRILGAFGFCEIRCGRRF